jgi:Beta-lactamase enzyme family
VFGRDLGLRRIVAVGAVTSSLLAVVVSTGSSGSAAANGRARPKACLVPGYRKTLNHLWRPDMAAAAAYAHSRAGDIAFAVRTDHRFYGYRANHVEWSASVVKAMLMVAYLDMPSVAHRPVNAHDNDLLIPMITQSDNNAATAVIGIVGLSGLRALAARVGMKSFEPVLPIWGETHITADDQTKFFYSIDSFIAPLHRRYGMHLLASITPSQRWGIGEVTPRGWTPYFKGGWGSGTGLIDHQVVLLKRGCARTSIAVLTMNDGSHAYGKETLKGMFARLLHRFPKGTPSRRR